MRYDRKYNKKCLDFCVHPGSVAKSDSAVPIEPGSRVPASVQPGHVSNAQPNKLVSVLTGPGSPVQATNHVLSA
jgi:hypothetical protein